MDSITNIKNAVVEQMTKTNSWCSSNGLCCIICVVILVIIVFFILKKFFKYLCNCKEGFESTTNYVYGNPYGEANFLEYGSSEAPPITENNNVSGPSSSYGVNQIDGRNVFDDRGFKWTKNPKSANIDPIMSEMSNDSISSAFKNMYMLDPSGSVSSYDTANMPISKQCCSATYAPPFETGGNNCDYAQKYVANNLMGDSATSDGNGCVCMTPTDAMFYTKRGGNA